MTESGLGALPKYDKNEWIDEALDRKGEEVVMNEGFEETHWYRFHQAAKAQFATVLELTKEL